jgi:N-succinyl-L-ornithine transcarbamylase
MLQADVDFVVTHPEGYDLAPSFTQGAVVTHDQRAAFEGADVIYAKNWSSYTDYGQILSKDMDWTVTAEKMRLTNDARFMHCLPVRRNMIVTDEVLDGPWSVVVEQAANRVVSAQTVLLHMLRELAR